jgi:uncharacterized membrane protein
MAKVNKQIKGRQVGQGGVGSFETQESYDDNLLPDAAELARLKDLDPEIISWLKERTSKEQDARHDFTDRRMGLMEKGQRRAFTVDVITVVCAFILMAGGMCLSYVLLKEKEILTGSLFGGATILFAARSFLNFRKNLQGEKDKVKEK